MKYPKTRLLFDRKNVATKNKAGLIQLEISFERQRKWIGTGIKVYKGQWHEQKFVVNRFDKDVLNARLHKILLDVDNQIDIIMQENKTFSWEKLEELNKKELNQKIVKEEESFIDFMKRRIKERTDISDSTKKNQGKSINSLLDFGRIVSFADLTPANIQDYYEWLMNQKVEKDCPDGTKKVANMAQATVWGYMKVLKIYIHDAMRRELLLRDPSLGIKVKKGDSEPGRWLTQDEVQILEQKEFNQAHLSRARDLFLVQCYTGLAYSDLMDFTTDKLSKDGELTILTGTRVKTGERYVSVVLPKMQRILEKYEYKLPKMSNQKYNSYLKDVAKEAKISKPIASHWARRTCGMLMLNKGYPIEIVARVLGHSDIKTTQHTYAQILNKTVVEAFKKYEKLK